MEIQARVAPTEIWLRDDLENIYSLLFRFLRFGFQRGLARDTEVRHSGARSHRLRAEASAARPRRALRHLSIHFFPASHCGAFCRTMEQRRHGRWRSHGSTVAQPLTATATVTLSLRACLFLCYTPITSSSAAEAAQRLRLDEEVLDAPEELRQPVVGVGGAQEEQGQERLALCTS